MNNVAESYVKLVLAVGQHDPDYVDAYYGPPEWRQTAKAENKSLDQIGQAAASSLAELKAGDMLQADPMLQLRHQYLLKQLQSLMTRVELVSGKKMRFDDEAKALYDVDPPTYPESHFSQILKNLETLLPGRGDLLQRYECFKSEFIIPNYRLDTVFSAAISEARQRTKARIPLPASETFKVEYVKDKSWSGYNWYKGDYYSLIEINTDLPIYIDRAVDLACHEGYPGHHVYNVLLEENLLRKRKWIEFSIYPLFSPQSLIAEGTANFGIEVAFPGTGRVEFERSVLFPLAGLDPSRAGEYHEVADLVAKLSYAGNEAARHYLDGEMTSEAALRWFQAYALLGRARAEQKLRFIDQYRSYLINYNLGLDLVKRYIESRGGTADKPEERWQEFSQLISSPRLPSGLEIR